MPEVPSLPQLEPQENRVLGEACAPTPPLFGVSARISECRQEMWIDRNYTFVLRRDGSILLWKAELYKEWSVVLVLAGACLGAIGLLVLVLLIVLFLARFNRLSNRGNSQPQGKLPGTA